MNPDLHHDFKKMHLHSLLRLARMRRRDEISDKEYNQKRRVIKIELNMSPLEYLESRVCGLENLIRKDFIIHDFELRTRAEREASIKYLMKGGKRYECLRLFRSTYK